MILGRSERHLGTQSAISTLGAPWYRPHAQKCVSARVEWLKKGQNKHMKVSMQRRDNPDCPRQGGHFKSPETRVVRFKMSRAGWVDAVSSTWWLKLTHKDRILPDHDPTRPHPTSHVHWPSYVSTDLGLKSTHHKHKYSYQRTTIKWNLIAFKGLQQVPHHTCSACFICSNQ